jgi:hypothetical protein
MTDRSAKSEGRLLPWGRGKASKNRLIRHGGLILFERSGKNDAPLEAGGICPHGQKIASVLC